MAYHTIEYETDASVGVIRLNRPERMNAVIEEMYLEIQNVLDRAQRDETVRALILTGSVLRKDGVEKQAFCAGADLKVHSTTKRDHFQKRAYILLAHETTRRLFEFPKPVIAALNGPARGAGAELALNCDFIFMAEKATIAFPETSLGTFVGGGVTYLLPRMVGVMVAKELIYSGKVIDGKEAVRIGLASKWFPLEELWSGTMAFARELSEKAPFSMRFAKKRLQDPGNLTMETVLQLEADAILTCMDTEDWHEGVRSFAEKRKPRYKGR